MLERRSENWNTHVLNQPSQAGIFLQSKEWGDFKESAGKRVLWLECNVPVLVEVKSLLLGLSYWYVPRVELDEDMFLQIMSKAQNAGVVFVRFEPMGDFKKGIRVSSVQPHQTHMIDVRKTDDELLSAMHSKTRYNVRLAGKRGVEVVFDHDGDHIEDFLKLIDVTSSRNSFGIHGVVYYRKQISQPSAFLVVAKYEGQVIATHLYWAFGDTLTYLHGASANEHRNVMAPHAIHFDVMRYAREQGLKTYDLWGIDEEKWSHLTRFKRGFGGEDVSYVGCFDVPVRRWLYRLYRIIKAFKS